MPPGAGHPTAAQTDPGETLDCLSGHWKIFQLTRGHRYSTDDLLTAWYAAEATRLSTTPPRHALDLGCGVGSVLMLLLWQFPLLSATGVEAQSVSAGLARRSLAYNGVEERADVRCGDLRDGSVLAPHERFDLVTASPPYLAAGEGRRSDQPQRGPCRFEERGGVRDYLRVAGRHLSPAGCVVWCHATRYREQNVVAARSAGFGSVGWRTVLFREGKESLITLFRGWRAADHPVAGEEGAPLVVRNAAGAWSPEYVQIRRLMGFPSTPPVLDGAIGSRRSARALEDSVRPG